MGFEGSGSVLLESFPVEERGKAMAFWGLGMIALSPYVRETESRSRKRSVPSRASAAGGSSSSKRI